MPSFKIQVVSTGGGWVLSLDENKHVHIFRWYAFTWFEWQLNSWLLVFLKSTQQICESKSIKISIPLSQCYPVFLAYQRWWQDLVWLLGSLCFTTINKPCTLFKMHCIFPSCCGPRDCDFDQILCSFSPKNFLSFLKHDYQANIPILSFSTAFRHLKRKCDLKEMWWPIKIDDSGLLSSRDYLTVSGSFLSMWNWAVACVLLFLLSPGGICNYQQKECKAVETKGVSGIVLEHVVMFSF